MTSPNVLGLDLALAHAGAAQLHQDGRVYTWRLDTDPIPADAPLADVDARIAHVARWAVQRGTSGTVLAVVEAPSYGSKFGQAHERAGIWWAVVRGLHRAGVSVGSVAPRSLASKIGGTSATKEVVRRELAKMYPGHGIAGVSLDESDALACAVLGVMKLAQHHGRSGPWKGPWLEARALNVDSGCRWPDLGPGWVKPKPAPIAPMFAVPS